MNWKQRFEEAARYSDPDRPPPAYTCSHPERAYRRFQTAHGREQVRHQCLRCGERGKAIPKAHVQALGLVLAELAPCGPDDLARSSDFYGRIEAIRLAKWFSVYRKYLQSPEWRSIRDRILARDKKHCQGCLQEVAVEAHHLTYTNIGEEFLFELVAIGPRCQSKLRLSEDKIPR